MDKKVVGTHVVGFAFDANREFVVLIKKNRPEFLAGFYNGVGGKVEPGEGPLDAIVREFKEETGAETDRGDWRYVVTVHSDEFVFPVYTTELTDLNNVQTKTDEEVAVRRLSDLDFVGKSDIWPNLTWMIPMCLDRNYGVAYMV